MNGLLVPGGEAPAPGTTADGADDKAITAMEISFGEVMNKRDGQWQAVNTQNTTIRP